MAINKAAGQTDEAAETTARDIYDPTLLLGREDGSFPFGCFNAGSARNPYLMFRMRF